MRISKLFAATMVAGAAPVGSAVTQIARGRGAIAVTGASPTTATAPAGRLALQLAGPVMAYRRRRGSEGRVASP